MSESRCGAPAFVTDFYAEAGVGLRNFFAAAEMSSEEDEKEELSDFEGRLGAGGGEGVEGRDVLEGLRDEDEDVSFYTGIFRFVAIARQRLGEHARARAGFSHRRLFSIGSRFRGRRGFA
jgi:hypothetical protein